MLATQSDLQRSHREDLSKLEAQLTASQKEVRSLQERCKELQAAQAMCNELKLQQRGQRGQAPASISFCPCVGVKSLAL